jgi:glucokinase
MAQVDEHVLVADVGGTNIGVAIFACTRSGRFEPVQHETVLSRKTRNLPNLLQRFLRKHGRVAPKITKACIDFAGPVQPGRLRAAPTNLSWTFSVDDIREATSIGEVTLINDFEAIGYGVETLIANRPEAFTRISRNGKLPASSGANKPTLAVIGAGTGLGTTALIYDFTARKYRPVPGEGGHTDFTAIEEDEFRIAQWIRRNINSSASAPLNREKVVSGPGLVNVYRALSELEPDLGDHRITDRVLATEPYYRPAIVAQNAGQDPLCRKALDTWIRCYAAAAKESAIFPLAPGGVFLAGGIAAKILPEFQTGMFMREFVRCDVPNIRAILKRIPVFVITDYRIGLYGCANVAVNGLP